MSKSSKRPFLVMCFTLLSLIVLFQNCGKTVFQQKQQTSSENSDNQDEAEQDSNNESARSSLRIEILGRPNLASSTNIAEITFEGLDDDNQVTSFQCTHGENDPVDCASPMTLTDLAAGDQSLKIQATNSIGETTERQIIWTVEPAPGVVSIVSGPEIIGSPFSASFTFTVAAGISTVECSLDGAAFAACESPVSFEDLPSGGHSFELRGTDAAGVTFSDRYVWSAGTGPTENDQGPAFRRPNDIDLNADGTFGYVSDTAAGTLFKVDMANGSRTIVSGPGVGSGPPLGIDSFNVTIDPQETTAYLTASTLDLIWSIDLETGDRTIVSSDSTGSGPVFQIPSDVILHPSGTHLYVADTRQDALVSVDIATGDRVIVSGPGVGAGPALSGPGDFQINAAGTLAYVVDSGQDAIITVDLANGDRTEISAAAIGAGPIWTTPTQIVVNAAETLAFVFEGTQGADVLYRVDLATGDRSIYSSANVGAGPAMTSGVGLTLSADETAAYVCHRSPNFIFEINLANGNREIISE